MLLVEDEVPLEGRRQCSCTKTGKKLSHALFRDPDLQQASQDVIGLLHQCERENRIVDPPQAVLSGHFLHGSQHSQNGGVHHRASQPVGR